MAKILSISAVAHDCGIAFIEDGVIKYALEEERFRRIKGIFNQFSFPDLSLKALEELCGITPFDEDVIVVMPKSVLCGLDYLERLVENKPVYLYDHHYAHACTAYYLSGFSDETLVFTHDGGDGNGIGAKVLTPDVLKQIREQKLPYRDVGMSEEEWTQLVFRSNTNDELSRQLMIPKDSWWFHKDHSLNSCRSTVSIGLDNHLDVREEIRDFDSIASLWNLYCTMNNMFGGKDEGKIVGLAAQGKFRQDIYDNIGDYFEFDGDLKWKHYYDCEYYFRTLDFTDPEMKKDGAYMIQYLTEKYFLGVISHLKKKYPSAKKLALAGGLFSNVKVNQKINELSEFDEIFIAPGMSDGGLALGAAIAKANEIGEFNVAQIDNVFWGNIRTEFNIPAGISKSEFSATDIAKSISKGKVVGIFSNRREWGPRALGGTSIMFDPRRDDAQEYVNMRLGRNDIMPFAPAVMDGFESIPFHCYKSKYASQFMTICYDVKDEWISRIPGVINRFDNTARIQITKESNKPFFPILSAFYKLTDVPVLMNTSFNIHGEPIINSTEEAFNHLINGVVDVLVIDGDIYEKSNSVASIFDT